MLVPCYLPWQPGSTAPGGPLGVVSKLEKWVAKVNGAGRGGGGSIQTLTLLLARFISTRPWQVLMPPGCPASGNCTPEERSAPLGAAAFSTHTRIHQRGPRFGTQVSQSAGGPGHGHLVVFSSLPFLLISVLLLGLLEPRFVPAGPVFVRLTRSLSLSLSLSVFSLPPNFPSA